MLGLTALYLCLIGGTSSLSKAQDQGLKVVEEKVLQNADVIELSKLCLSDLAVIERIRCANTDFRTGHKELKRLRLSGVSESVIREMIRSQAATTVRTNPVASSGSVAPRHSTGGSVSNPTELSPAQVEAQEKALLRTYRSVPVPCVRGLATSAAPLNQPTDPAEASQNQVMGPSHTRAEESRKRRNNTRPARKPKVCPRK
jgi:hypothetical protein